jgi:hypothetical protein
MSISRLTRITLPIEVVLGVAVAASIQSGLLASWAVSKRYMPISNIVEKVDLILVQ